jgi:hypothetical protein
MTASVRALAGVLLIVSLASFAAGTASELTIRNTAIEKMLLEELFIDRGRYQLIKETRCQFAYLDSPAVTISQGRVRIKVRLSGRLAMEVAEQCVGGGSDVVRLTVSGRPVYSGEKIGLTDIRLDEVSNEAYRPLLQQFLESAVPRAVTIDVRDGLQRVLADRQSKVEVTVSQLSVTELSAEDNILHAALTFSLSAR